MMCLPILSNIFGTIGDSNHRIQQYMIEKFKDIKGFLSEHEGSALSEYCEKFCIGELPLK